MKFFYILLLLCNEIFVSLESLNNIILISKYKKLFSFRFWETDIRTVRKTNQSTIRRKNAGMKTAP